MAGSYIEPLLASAALRHYLHYAITATPAFVTPLASCASYAALDISHYAMRFCQRQLR
jgi:hypothetical protein